MSKFNIQLYSVKELLKNDFSGTLDLLKEIGYTGVEFAGYYEKSSKEMKKELDDRGLMAVSSHVAYEKLINDPDRELEYLSELGCTRIVCPYAEINTVESAKEYAEKFNKIGEKCASMGFSFSYHNHAHEFTKDYGVYPLDILYTNTDPKYVKAQIDVYWVAYGNEDPYKYVSKYKNRMDTVHLKQISKEKTNVDAPDGIIDFKKVVDLTNNAIPIYEQEKLTIDNGRLSIERSFAHLYKVL